MNKKARLRQIGKIGRINIQANKKLKQIYLDRGIVRCEICGSDFALSWHHRKKRVEYIGHPEKLGEFSETILLCSRHHDELEGNKKLSDEMFNKLR